MNCTRIYGHLATMYPALPLIFQVNQRNSPAHIIAILRLYHHLAESTLDRLEANQLDHLLNECVQMFASYFSYCRFVDPSATTISTTTAQSLVDSQQHEQYQETLECLKILRVIIEWLRSDFDLLQQEHSTTTTTTDNNHRVNIFWQLLNFVLPSIFASPSLMQHRKLAHTLFQTIHSLFNIPSMVF